MKSVMKHLCLEEKKLKTMFQDTSNKIQMQKRKKKKKSELKTKPLPRGDADLSNGNCSNMSKKRKIREDCKAKNFKQDSDCQVQKILDKRKERSRIQLTCKAFPAKLLKLKFLKRLLKDFN